MVERYVDHVSRIARTGTPAHLRTKLDRDDVVQDALLKVLKAGGAPAGLTEAEASAYLRKVVASARADSIRRHDRGKRRASRERSLEGARDGSSIGPEDWLAADHSTPSQRAVRAEDLMRLAKAIADLPEDQRRAVELHHLQGRSLEETADAMAKTRPAAAGLLRRGVQALRDRLREGDGP